MTATKGARRPVVVGSLVGTLVGLVVLGPALAPGYTLHYDLVFVPDLPLSARTLGTDGSVPRAVPNDLVVALLGTVLPGWLVHKLVLLGCFVVGGAGAGALARTLPGAAAGAVLLTWNPWVGERLGIGHWGYLIGYAVLPWVLVAATGPRSPRRRALLVAALTVAALGGSTPGVIATLLANAAWWWPFLRTASRAADPGGATAFAAAADTPFGILGSLVLGGGLWNDRTWFVERSAWPASAAALVAVVVVLGLSWSRREWWRDPRTRAATVAGVVGLVLAALAALPGGRSLLEAVVTGVPGGGLLRDGQKFAALWALLLVVALTHLVDRMASVSLPVPLLLVAIAWPVATLPTLAWGHSGAWGSVEYPAELRDVSTRLAASGEPVAVFPWSTYRRYAWNDDRVVLDPWNRLLPQTVVSDDRLPLRDRTVAGEDRASDEVTRALAQDPADVVPVLRGLGVRWVVVQTDQPSPAGSVPDLDGVPVQRVGDLRVADLGAPQQVDVEPDRLRGLGLVGTGLAVVLALGLVVRHRRT